MHPLFATATTIAPLMNARCMLHSAAVAALKSVCLLFV